MKLLKDIRLVVDDRYQAFVEKVAFWWQIKVAAAESRVRRRKSASKQMSEYEKHEESLMMWADHQYIMVLLTEQIQRDCVKYGVPLPPSELYDDFFDSGMKYLGHDEMRLKQLEINLAKSERAKESRAWMAALTGLIGVLIGLISALF